MEDKPDFLDLAPADKTAGVNLETQGHAPVTFRGNGYDLAAIVGVTVGGIVLLSCVTCNLAYYFFPFIPIILGIVGLVAAKDSVNPERTKLLSWFSLGSGAIFFILAFVCVIAYIGFIVFAIAADSGGF